MSEATEPESHDRPIELDRPRIELVLRDGSVAEVGPLSAADAPLLAQGLDDLSEASRFARFGSGLAGLSPAQLRYLTDVDQVSHVAWGALIDDRPAGAGRYIVGPGADAEMAITVVDRYQRRGLGRILFDALIASARASGIEGLYFSIEPWNRVVPHMLNGVDIAFDGEEGMLSGRIEIGSVPVSEHETEFVRLLDEFRRAGSGQSSDSTAGSSSSEAELMQ
jgi:GNAT superfamily N-acetyltransferase